METSVKEARWMLAPVFVLCIAFVWLGFLAT